MSAAVTNGHRAGEAVLVLMIALALAVPVSPQSGNEGSIEGTVSDASGAVIPGAGLTIRNVNTSATFTTSTDDSGLFRFLVLPVGTYELVAEHPGFATLIQKGVVVTVGAKINLTLSLSVAAQSEIAEVSGETPLIESTRSQVSSTFDAHLVASLPVNGRNFLDFVLLTRGVIRNPLFGGFSIGGQNGMNSVLLDGADNNNTFFGVSSLGFGFNLYQVSQEAVQEFQVNANSYSAELGRAGAGVVNVVTKSGTNDFHGVLFWYFRDRGLNATGFINKITGEPKDPFHAHQFGGALGGPLKKNRLFFFGSYDSQRRKQQNLVFLNLPSGFRLSSDPTVAAFQQRALDYLAPRAASWVRTFDPDVVLAKVDWQVTSAHSLSGRWNRHRFFGANQEVRAAAPQNSVEHTGDSENNSDTLVVSLTSTLSPLVVNVARFSYVRSNEPGRSNNINPEAQVFEGGQLVLTIGRLPISPRQNAIRRGEWSDTVSFSQGRHAFKVGANVLVDRILFFTAPSFSGSYRFNSLQSFGRNLAAMPMPISGERYIQAFSGEGSPGVTVHPNFVEFAGFAQDEWRAHPNLTFNLGLRYDIQRMAKPGVKKPSAALSAVGLDTSFIPRDNNNFAPRFGLAWSPLQNGHLVVRGGYGLFYARTGGGLSSRAHFMNGVSVQTRTFTGASIPLYPNTLCGTPDPSGVPPTCPAPTAGADIIMPFSPDFTQPLVQQGSFGMEYQLQKDLALSLTYLWVHGTHLSRYRDINLGTPTTPTTIGIAETNTVLTYQRFSLPRPIAGFDRILLLESNASSVYHGMAVQLHKRLAHNFQLLASYTLSKVLDDRPDPAPLNPGDDSRLLSDSSNPRLDRGPGISDQRHRFVLSGIWQLNYANRLPTSAKALLGGWQFSGILTAQSGQPYSGLVNFDLNNDGNAADRTPGLGRNTFYLPTTISFDPRLTRNVRFTERLRFQFIWEAFNVFNRANISNVRTTQYSRSTSATACGIAGTPCLIQQSNFGTPTASSGPRIMQFALKLLF